MIRYWVGRAAYELGSLIAQYVGRIVELGWWLQDHGIEAPVEHEPIGYAELVKPLWLLGDPIDVYTPASDYLESMGVYHKGDC